MSKKKKKPISARNTRQKRKRDEAARRARANLFNFEIDFSPFPDDVINKQTLAGCLPLPPAHTHQDPASGKSQFLNYSPARTWLEAVASGMSKEAKETIERWPFRIVRANQGVPSKKGWTCLRLLALGAHQSVEEVSRSLVELEGAGLQYWHSRGHEYVMPTDLPDTKDMTPQEARLAVDTFLARRSITSSAQQ